MTPKRSARGGRSGSLGAAASAATQRDQTVDAIVSSGSLKQLAMKLAVVLFVAGLGLLAYALSIPPYKNQRLYEHRYLALSAGQNEAFSKLREEMVTPRYGLEDYAATAIVLALGLLLVSRRGWKNLSSPRSRAGLVVVAFVAPVLSFAAMVVDLQQGFGRGEYPWWGDSLGIPLVGDLMVFALLLAWSMAHLLFLRRDYASKQLSSALSLGANKWLLLLSAITAALIVYCAGMGDYTYLVPGGVWLYFYLSLAAARSLRGQGETRSGSLPQAAP